MGGYCIKEDSVVKLLGGYKSEEKNLNEKGHVKKKIEKNVADFSETRIFV